MKLTVLTWLRDSSITLIGRTIEIIFRTILFCLPLGVYLLLIQLRSKASKISNISVYTDEKSCWQHIFPGFILVAVDENMLKNKYNEIKKNFQTWIFNNRFILSFLAILLIILLISLILFMRAV